MGLLEKIRKKNKTVENIVPEVIDKKPEENYQVEENQITEVKKVGFLDKLLNRTQKEFEDVGIVIEKPKPEFHIVDDYYIKEPFSKINNPSVRVPVPRVLRRKRGWLDGTRKASGWGIRPKTRPDLSEIPAMSRSEPLGFSG